MKQRCYRPTCNDFEYYGGRGIAVCDRWRNSFESFLADMGERPAGMTLDRLDNDRNYEPANCRWATHRQQAEGRGNSRTVTAFGITGPLSRFIRDSGIPSDAVYRRLNAGWPTEWALSVEPMTSHSHGTRHGRRAA